MAFIFETVDVKQGLVDQLKEELKNFGYTGNNTIKVIKADPREASELPCIGINRIEDSESDQSLSEGEGTAYDKETKALTTFRGTFFSEAMEIRVWHTNADERDKLYQTVKAILFARRNDFIEKGLLNVTLRGGRDEQDSTMAQAPVILYWSTITMSYLNPLDVSTVATVEPITAIVPGVKLVTNIDTGGQ